MRRLLPHRLFAPLLLGLALVVLLWPQLLHAAAPAESDLDWVWQRVRESGAYEFQAEMVQTTQPLATVRNVGRQTKEQRTFLRGESDLKAQAMHLTLWQSGGQAQDPASGLEIEMEGGKARARQGMGEWEEIQDWSGMVAPGGDMLAYSAAARDVTRHAPEQRDTPLGTTLEITRYTFAIDGPAYARTLRDQMRAQLLASGEMPAHVQTELPRLYAEMTGEGELWVGPDGFPIRQHITLAFPPRESDQITAELITDFSHFRPVTLAFNPISPSYRTAALLREVGAWLTQPATPTMLLLLLAVPGAMVWMTLNRRSRVVYAAVAGAVSLSLVVGPLLQVQQSSVFAATQYQAQAEQEAEQATYERYRETQASLKEPAISPHVEPETRARLEREAQARLGEIESESDDGSIYFDDLCETDPDGNEDQAGPTNLEECLIGTLPGYEDSDFDGINDEVEVAGFSFGGQMWYTDPLENDSNLDGLGDDTEWYDSDGDGLPDDHDGDGTPDLWDEDNDGDGVPDEDDLSPYFFSHSDNGGYYDSDTPLELILDGLTAGEPTTVQFQVVPSDPARLWYSLNVLDWPGDDKQGQMQDADDATFYDQDSSLNSAPFDYGDLQLVPMLEILISGETDNLPSAEELEEYNITLSSISTDTNNLQQVAYVPLSLVTTEIGEEHVAFYGEMLYTPDATWGNAHEVRLVWMVQALVDSCERYTDGVCSEYSESNDVQVIHVYEDEWAITGLHVREDNGTDLGIVYEDPDVDDDPRDDDDLYKVAAWLDAGFLGGTDRDEDGERDYDLDELYRVFEHTVNASVPISETGGVATTSVILTGTYESIDYAAADLVGGEIEALLDDEFTPVWSESAPVTPTILVAREELYRSVNLDDARLSGQGSYIGWNGATLTVDFADSSQPVGQQLLASFSWAPYAYNNLTESWESADLNDYVATLYAMVADELADEGDEDVIGGYSYLIESYYSLVNSGVSSIVEYDGIVVAEDLIEGGIYIFGSSDAATKGINYFINKYYKKLMLKANQSIAAFYYQVKTFSISDFVPFSSPLKWAKQLWATNKAKAFKAGLGIGLMLITVVAAIALIILKATQNGVSQGTITAITITGYVFAVASLIYEAVRTAIMVYRAVKLMATTLGSTVRAVGAVLTMSSELIGAAKIAGVIGLILEAVIIVGLFIYLWASGAISPGSVQFTYFLAYTLVGIAYAVLLFIISLTIVGAILVLILAIVDLILYFTAGWTISDWVISNIAKLLVEAELTVTTDTETGTLSSTLTDESAGYVEGNSILYSFPLTTTLKQEVPYVFQRDGTQYLILLAAAYGDPEDNSMAYELSDRTADQSGFSTSLGAMDDDWDKTRIKEILLGNDLYRLTKSEVVTSTAVTLDAGINDTAYPLYLNTAYELIGYSCLWLYCDRFTHSDASSSEIGENLILDVYPATVDGFMDLTSWANGQITRLDADGDGLLSAEYDGLDPDDNDWDSDNDGLSDAYELEMQSLSASEGGLHLDPLDNDTDGDGLDDRTEVLNGTDPGVSDSDGDGLLDSEERMPYNGWSFAYNVAGDSAVIFSNPLYADEDGDGLDDLAEKNLHDGYTNPYNPNVWNESPLTVEVATSDEDGIVGAGSSFFYTSTLANNLSQDYAISGDLTVTLPPELTGSPLQASMDLQPGSTQSLVSTLQMASGASSGIVTLTSSAEGEFYTPSAWDWSEPQSSESSLSGSLATHATLLSPDGWSAPYVGVVREECPLAVSYYHNTTYSGTPAATACEESSFYYDWGSYRPTGNNTGNWSAIWSGDLYFPASGSWHFYTNNNSASATAEVWINGTRRIQTTGTANSTVDLNLSEGLHDIEIRFVDTGSTARMGFGYLFNDDWSVSSAYDDSASSHIYAYLASAEGLSGTGTRLDTDNTSGTTMVTRPGFACNESGACLTTWGWLNDATGISGASLHTLPNSLTGGTLSTILSHSDGQHVSAPSLASDGEDFLVVWREFGNTERLQMRRYHADGSAVDAVTTLHTASETLDEVAVAWVGTRYLAVWSDGSDLQYAYISASGDGASASALALERNDLHNGLLLPENERLAAYASTPPATLAQTGNTDERDPAIIFDPSGQQTLILFRDQNNRTLTARLFSASSLSDEFSLVTFSGNEYLTEYTASSDPVNGGWIVGWSSNYAAYYTQGLAQDGTLRGSQSLSTGDALPARLALACLEPRPLLDLTFDDDSAGSTTFLDGSGYGNNATCTNCPTAGVDGQEGSALYFNQDSATSTFDQPRTYFSTAFWFRSPCLDCAILQRGDHSLDIRLIEGNLCVDDWHDVGLCTTGQNYADDTWHHVVHTYANGSSKLYLDGTLKVSGFEYLTCPTSGLCATETFILGKANDATSNFIGYLDEVQHFDRTLTASEVGDEYDAAFVLLDMDDDDSDGFFFNEAGNDDFAATCSGTSCPTDSEGVAYRAQDFDGSSDYLKISTGESVVTTYEYDFEQPSDTNDWSSSTVSYAVRNGAGTSFLGSFTNPTIQLNLSDLPLHDEIEIEFELYLSGSWDGNRTNYGPDQWRWSVDGSQQANYTFALGNDPSTGNGLYQSYPSAPASPSGITLYQHSNAGGDSTLFTADDSTFSDDAIGNDRMSWWTSSGNNTVAIIYEHGSYGGDDWFLDTKEDIFDSVGNDKASSIRVWRAQYDPAYGANEVNTLVGVSGSSAVYKFTKTIDTHTADSLNLSFTGAGLTDEYWGLDNVKITLKQSGVTLHNRSFTLAAWAKRDTTGNGDFILGQGAASSNQGLHFGFRSNNQFTCAFWSNDLNSGTTYTDSDWHHWACTYDEATNTRILYRDGVEVVRDNPSSAYVGFGDVYIGKLHNNTQHFNGRLDELGIWGGALSAEAIQDLYEKKKVQDDSVSLCLLAQVEPDDTLTGVRLALRETRTDLGGFDENATTATLDLVVDNDAPSAEITSLPSSAHVRVADTLIIGGAAVDEHSWVEKVEIQVDGGAWEAVEGTEAWSYAWDTSGLSDGAHTFEVRAWDTFGNTEWDSFPFRIILDRTAPTVTSDLASNSTITATPASDARWLLPLSGTVVDPGVGEHPGSGTIAVEALLVGSADHEGNGWQSATLDGTTWSLDYQLTGWDTDGSHLAEPTGAYTLLVRSHDDAGNVTPEASYVSVPFKLDLSAPLATLSLNPPEGAVAFFPLADPAGSDSAADVIGGLAATCGDRTTACPTASLHQSFTFADEGWLNTNSAVMNLTNADFTLSLWVNTTSTSGMGLLSKDDGDTSWERYEKHLYLDSSGRPNFVGWGNEYIRGSQAVNDGDWHHIAVVWDYSGSGEDGTGTMYVDGVNVTSQDTYRARNADVATHTVKLGRQNYSESQANLTGDLRELTFHQQALDVTAIADLYGRTEPSVISDTLTIAGAIVEPGGATSGIESAELALVPMEELALREDLVLHLPLDEPPSSPFFRNVASGSDATCDAAANGCPASGVAGIQNRAAHFDGSNDYLTAGQIDLANRSFTLGAWAKRESSGSHHYILSQGTASTNQGLHFGFRSNNQFTCAFWNNDLNSGTTFTDSDWHHWACTYDADSNLLTMYRDGSQIAQTTTPSDYLGSGPILVGRRLTTSNYFDGLVDEVTIHQRPLSANEVARLARWGEQAWHPVTLDASGAGVTHTTWSATLPANQPDGFYQLHLRATDSLGNFTPLSHAIRIWRGEIDLNLPSLQAVAVQSGSDSGGTDTRQTAYRCTARDFNLDSDAACRPAPTIAEDAVLALLFDGLMDNTEEPDASGHDNPATCSGSACPTLGTPGMANLAATFDGVDDGLQVADTSDINLGTHTHLSVAAWVRASNPAASTAQMIYEQGGTTRGLNLYVMNNTLYGGGWNNSDSGWAGSYLTAPIDSDWHHVTLVLSGTSTVEPNALTLYLDGVPIGSANGSQLWEHASAIGVGAMRNGTQLHTGDVSDDGFFFAGEIDHLLVVGGALSASEVADLYAIRPTLPDPNSATSVYTTYDQVSEWYSERFTDTSRLYDVQRDWTLSGHHPANAMEACDSYGRCARVNPVTESVYLNVPEAAEYRLLYALDLPANADYGASGTPDYRVDQSAAVGPFDRVAYYLELVDSNGVSQWVYASMNAFTPNATLLGIPADPNGPTWEQTVSNLNVATNVSGITTGTGIGTGNIEFWHNCYSQTANSGIGGNGSSYDFDDTMTGADCYGSFQIHNYGAGQTLLAWNRWAQGNNNDDLGIGNRATSHPDWTFAQNANSYTFRTLYVLVRETGNPVDAPTPPTPPTEESKPTPTPEAKPTEESKPTPSATPTEETEPTEESKPTATPEAKPTEESKPTPSATPTEETEPTEESKPTTTPEVPDGDRASLERVAAPAGQPLLVAITDEEPAATAEPLPPQATPTAEATPTKEAEVEAMLGEEPAPLVVTILSPAVSQILTSTTPISLTGQAQAPRALRSLSLALNGTPLHTWTWAESEALTDTLWELTWIPPAQGRYTLSADLLDWDGNSASAHRTFLVDSEAPTLTIAPTVLTATHTIGNLVTLRGSAEDATLDRVQVQVEGGPWRLASTQNGPWQLPLHDLGRGDPLDGTTVAAQGRATDSTGHQTTLPVILTVDTVSPRPPILSLRYVDTGGKRHTIAAQDTLTDATALELLWGTSQDGSGVAGYWVGWNHSPTATLADLTYYAKAGSHEQPVGDVERWYAHAFVRDTLGNVSQQSVGPIHVDGPRTPDLLTPLAYHGWHAHQCSLISADHRAAQSSSARISTRSQPQQLFATWDATDLRLSWQGADWQHAGDLFLYLDSGPGGATQLFDPYPVTPGITTTIYLPGGWPMSEPPPAPLDRTVGDGAGVGADYLVWVEDRTTATLWQWDGSQWQQSRMLDSNHYRWHGSPAPVTDLRLPFAWLAIADPATTTLKLLGVATAEERLHIWATAPERNPVNHPQLIPPTAEQPTQVFALSRPLSWSGLAAGDCPNGRLDGPEGAFAHSDLRFSLTAEPGSSTYGFYGDHLFWLWDVLFGDGPPIPSQAFAFRDAEHPPLGDGSELTYTLSYHNAGREAATGIRARLMAWYAADLPGGSPMPNGTGEARMVDLGTLPPGASGTYSFTVSVNLGLAQQRFDTCLQTLPPPECETIRNWVGLNVEPYDDRSPFTQPGPGAPPSPPVEWMWADHPVDRHPPGFVGIESPVAFVTPGSVTLSGYAFDASVIPMLHVEWQQPDGTLTTHACPDAAPLDGQWTCTFETGEVADGDAVAARVQAEDKWGHISPWSDWHPLTVDATAPTVTATLAQASGLVDSNAHTLSGTIEDDRDVGAVQICRTAEEECTRIEVQVTESLTPTGTTVTDLPAAPLPLDSSLLCPSPARLTRTLAVAENFAIGDLDVGLLIEHPERSRLAAWLQSPSGTRVQLLGAPPTNAASYHHWNVRLSDQATQPLHAPVHDDPTAPPFTRWVRPLRALAAFNGESSEGDWTLTLCQHPSESQGAYLQAALFLTPRAATLNPTGTWHHVLPSDLQQDGSTQTFSVYALDSAGNRSPDPLIVSYQLDTEPPTLALTNAEASTTTAPPAPYLSGTVQDGSERVEVIVRALPATGAPLLIEATVQGGTWQVARPLPRGDYRLWVEARDMAGNVRRVGPLPLAVRSAPVLYLPLLHVQYHLPYDAGEAETTSVGFIRRH